jgi:hypothetical protein
MKKLLLILVTTLALWAISTFIIGNKTQENLQNYINKSNKIYTNNGIKLKLIEYEHSFLNSTAQIEIDFLDPKVIKLLEKEYLLPLTMNYNIEHGPLFFKNGLGVGLSKFNNSLLLSSLFKEETKKEFLALVKKDIKLQSEMVLSFSKTLHYRVKSDEILVNKDKKIFYMSPFTLQGVSDIETFNGEGTVKIAKFKLKEEETNNGIELDNIIANMKIDEIFKESLLFGDFKFSIAKILINDALNPKFKKIDISMDGEMNNRRVSQNSMDSNFIGTIHLANTQLEKQFQELESIQIAMKMKELGIKGMFEFQNVAQNIQKEQSKLIKKLQTQKPEEMQSTLKELKKVEEKIVTQLIYTLNNLLIKDKTSISYSLDVKTKDKQSSQAFIEVGYTGDMKFQGDIQELTEKMRAQLLSLIRVKLNILLNKKHLSLLPVPMLKQQLQMGVAQGFVKENNNSYTLNGYYKDKELIVNDNNLTSTVLPLLMMLMAR